MDEQTPVRATVSNMYRAWEAREAGDRRLPMAYSPVTGETASADPGNYWDHPLTYCVLDRWGNEMILRLAVP